MTMLLQARSVGVSRGANELLSDLDFTANSGDRIGIVGHNGSGKTTLLRLLAGELSPERGEIIRKRNLRLAMVEQFLPERLLTVSLRDAVAENAPADESWRADAVLSELGFAIPEMDRASGEFSGGQQNRLMLARTLGAEPELLLLEEPTNHLYLATLLVFESLLSRFPGALILVSHDREFLDAVTNATFLLRDSRGYRFTLNYSDAMSALTEMDEAHARTRAAEERKISALRDSAKRLATWGKVYDSEKFARRAKSMERRIERLEEDRTFVSDGSPLELQLELGETRAKQALAIENFPVEVPGRRLYDITELVIRPGDRVALLGANGTGKTTLIRAIMSAYSRPETLPQIRFSPQSTVGYYDQELDEVAGRETLLSFACSRVEASEQYVRTRLIRAGFAHADHGKRVVEMSGGERARLLFCVHALRRPNFLILDEPTNHIDIAGKEQLESELLASNATLIITSHDRRFLTRLANRYLWIRDGKLLEVAGPETFFANGGEGDEFSRVEATGSPAVTQTRSVVAPAREDAADQLLEQIVELETRLSDDQARKPKFQKPALQAQWRLELSELYAELEALESR
jgi:ATPase subunit of ABC transporter with duplicated ATPase domains